MPRSPLAPSLLKLLLLPLKPLHLLLLKPLRLPLPKLLLRPLLKPLRLPLLPLPRLPLLKPLRWLLLKSTKINFARRACSPRQRSEKSRPIGAALFLASILRIHRGLHGRGITRPSHRLGVHRGIDLGHDRGRQLHQHRVFPHVPRARGAGDRDDVGILLRQP